MKLRRALLPRFRFLCLTILAALLLTAAAAPRAGFAREDDDDKRGLSHRVARLEAALALLQTNCGNQNAKIAALEAKNAQLDARIAALEVLTQDMSRREDPNTGAMTVRFSAVNLQVVDGTGDTVGPVNGLGNLIVGYNERRGGGDNRTGSHNFIVGYRNNYASFGGLVSGHVNAVTGAFASITGGFGNVASGMASSVTGGNANSATGMASTVSGGLGNLSNGDGATIGGGSSIVLSSFLGWSAGGSGPVGTFHMP